MLSNISQPAYEKISRLLHTTDRARSDPINPLCMLILAITGVFFIYSAQSYSGGSQWIMQLVWIALGTTIYSLISLLNYKIYLEYAHIIYALSILLLLLLWTPLGDRVFGALRWLNFKFFSVQPSDTAKIGTLILAASILARSKIGRFRDSLKVLIKIGLAFLIPIVLIFLQPDLGSALVFPPMLFSLLYISKLSKRFFISTFVIFLLSLGIVAWDISNYASFLQENNLSPQSRQYEQHSLLPLKDYQRNRILAFAAPEIIDPKGIGDNWNLRQSLIAIGSGGLTGKGHMGSTQAKLGYLPQSVAPNDFIFSVLAEETGFIGGLSIIALLGLLTLNSLRIASNARDRFGMFLALGASIIFIVHIFINIGMTIGIMPITGLPLPFLSYGGSFLISCCILQGLVQSVHRFRRDF